MSPLIQGSATALPVMYQIGFRVGPLGSVRPLAGFKGLYFYGEGGDGKGREELRGIRGKGR